MLVEITFLTAFVTSVVSVLGKKLAIATLSEIKKYVDVEYNLRELTSVMYKVQLNLKNVDAEYSAHSTFRSWLLDLTMLCYEVDDIIDDINLEIMKLDQQYPLLVEPGLLDRLNPWCNTNGYAERRVRVRQIISSSVSKWKLPNKVAELLRRVKTIEKDVDDVVRHTTAKPRSPPINRRNHPDESYNTLVLPEGRTSEKQDIIKKLLQMQNGGVSIVGMAGLGKSILAHSIINNGDIRQDFNVIHWASSAASNWNVDSISINPIEKRSKNVCQQQSSSSSSTCRSLLLLDDLRIAGIREWKGLIAALAKLLKHKPTHILVTSRDPAVAKYTDTTLHHLRLLSITDCEDIIKSKVPFFHYGYHLPLHNSNIAHKCGGLPLVADLIGDYLRSEYNSHPNSFKNAITKLELHNLWDLRVFLKEVVPELGFDEASLPENLHKFLAYFALFPSEYAFEKNYMSLLWMSEGFTYAEAERNQQMSFTPEIDHFHELVARSVLKLTGSSPKGNEAPLKYHMHKFVHKFAQTIACSTYFQLDEAGLSSIMKGDIPSSYLRHFSSCCKKLEEHILKFIGNNHSKLRTFLLVPNYEIKIIQAIPLSLFKKLKFLRVLSLRGSDITELPHTISSMKHLRYLDVSYTCIMRLPIGLCNLLALQVVKLKSCMKLLCLPEKFESLINLIHLELDMSRLDSTPPNLGKLTKLQTLPVFIVKRSRGHHVSELKKLNSLRNSIKINKLENVASKREAEEAMLYQKLKIEKLELEWTGSFNQNSSLAEDVLTGLKPSDKLKELNVSNYHGIKFPDWIVSTLKHVASISLYNCPNCTVFPSLGLLPLLKRLKIEGMSQIEIVHGSNSNRAHQQREYPTLDYLEIRDMESLVEWNMLVPENMPYLRTLRVIKCPQLLRMSMIGHPSVIRPLITGCPRLSNVQQ